jgi:hypothetical protein
LFGCSVHIKRRGSVREGVPIRVENGPPTKSNIIIESLNGDNNATDEGIDNNISLTIEARRERPG